ncbi:flagellar basal body rod protein FlgC [Gammaproteobacteria bacterium]|nr:flagellar basal body rod protein FlgC [Gammaproteobacteria bacterium]
MKLDDIMSVAGAALEANTVRMNLAVSNIANAEVLAGNENDAFKAKRAVFRTILENEVDKKRGEVSGGVRIQEVIEDTTSHTVSFDPNHPDANEEGYVYLSNVNAMNELVEMTAAARSFETNVEALNTAKQLMLRTVELLKK